MKTIQIILLFVPAIFLLGSCGQGHEQRSEQEQEMNQISSVSQGAVERSTQAQTEFRASDYSLLRNAYFGDLHLHTGYSFDASAAGVTTVPEDAYRYAIGEEVEYMGRLVQRNKPLDFLAVTDHAEYLGIAPEAAKFDGLFADTDWPERIAAVADRPMGTMSFFSRSGFQGAADPIPEFVEVGLVQSIWGRQVAAAEQFYRPGEFTSFVAFEWSPMPAGAHLHRNVIFKGPEFPELPFSTLDSFFPEDLWSYAEAQRQQGMDSVLIPHSSNLSEGLMFDYRDSNGEPLTKAYAERRSENERLLEITQVKGTSESRPEFSPDDEFIDFELLPVCGDAPVEEQRGGYVRPSLARGLEIEQEVGVNPFRYGFVGASDFHSGVSSGEEDNYPGSLGTGDSQEDPQVTLTTRNPVMNIPITQLSASGITGVWAEQNTREAIFDALKRREVYATSGTRIRVRMFASTEYSHDILEQNDWLQTAYEQGVPMGSDLILEDKNKAPVFVLQALKDPDGANLDRLQIIKVWIDERGETHEKIFEALWGGERQLSADGSLPAVGSSVDLTTATYTNTIGAPSLTGLWQDPEFDPEQSSLYYARVIEIPTPRWPTYLAVRNNLPLSTDMPPTLQERAWTSPLYYVPE